MKTSDVDVLSRAPGKGWAIALWAMQIILALLFLFAGLMKFVMPVAEMTKNSSLPAWFFHFIGVAEVLGGIGLVLPALLRVLPFLTPIAACGLAIIMAGATMISMPMGRVALFPLVTGVLTVFVAMKRPDADKRLDGANPPKQHAQDGRGVKRPAERADEFLSSMAARSRALWAY